MAEPETVRKDQGDSQKGSRISQSSQSVAKICLFRFVAMIALELPLGGELGWGRGTAEKCGALYTSIGQP